MEQNILKTRTRDKILPQIHPPVEDLSGKWPKSPGKYQPTVENTPSQGKWYLKQQGGGFQNHQKLRNFP
jgi:hypothetical protein